MGNYIFDKKTYDILIKCSQAGNYLEWDQLRENTSEIYLEGADLENLNLQGVNLSKAHLSHAKFNNSKLHKVNFQRVFLSNAEMKNTKLVRSNLRDANIDGAKFQKADMTRAELHGVNAQYSNLEKANLHNSYLQGADFSYSIVDGETLLDTPNIDRNTLFTSVGISSARLKPGLIESLNYNIRKLRWEEWYNDGIFLKKVARKILVWPFWLLSDYAWIR